MFDESILLGETNFEENIKEIVEPYLEQCEEKGYVKSFDGTKIHFHMYRQKQSLGNLVICHGFCEFAEKFEEMIYYFHKLGYSIYVVEHRGHGFSDRKVVDNEMVHVNSYDEYIKDFHVFLEEVVPEKNRFLLAHSMGGAIGIRYLELYPDAFERAVLTSPMCGMQTGKYPKWLAKCISDLMCLFGKKEVYAFGQHGFSEVPQYESSSCISKARYMFCFRKRLNNMNYRTYGGSFKWVSESLKATKILMKPKNIKKIKCPILLLQAGKDHMVDNKAQDSFIKYASTARIIKFMDAKHEIFNSTENSIALFYKQVYVFLLEG